MEKNNFQKICLVIPSLKPGGAERVISELANHFVEQKKAEVYIILLTGGERFYKISSKIKILEPNFNYKNYNRIIFTFKILYFLRYSLKHIKPHIILSFGGRYNSFVIFASLGLVIKIFVSDRSEPGISHGILQNIINPLLYKKAFGIIAQTKKAKQILFKIYKYKNIEIIGNPIQKNLLKGIQRQNIILNVGRFIPSKQQNLLVQMFSNINNSNWQLFFLGDGEEIEKTKRIASESKLNQQIHFLGNQIDIEKYYSMSKIFAFTSISEGFPNVLGEAMSAGMACISFDCIAGPSELIDDGVNGFLIPEMDIKLYEKKLVLLMENEDLRNTFGKNAKQKIKQFEPGIIAEKYYQFIHK